jgi:hypothetical protein
MMRLLKTLRVGLFKGLLYITLLKRVKQSQVYRPMKVPINFEWLAIDAKFEKKLNTKFRP